MRQEMKWAWITFVTAAALLLLVALSGCATVTTPSGLQIKYIKMPLIDSDVATIYKHEWLDGDNVLHEESLTINADMRAEKQLEALKAGLAAGAAIHGIKGNP